MTAIAALAQAQPMPPTPGMASPQPPIGRIEVVRSVEPSVGADGGPVLVPATIEYEWLFGVPVATWGTQRIWFTAPEVSMVARRWGYETPVLRDKRLKLWDIPEITCKYADLILPNECKTVWHGVYVDVPQLASGHAHVDYEVPRVRMTEQSVALDVVRLTWTEKRFRFSLPALAPAEAVERVRISLQSQRGAIVAASDDALAAIDRDIAAIEANGGDPTRLVADDGSPLDLAAQRQAFVDERARELNRLAAIDAELLRLPAQR